MDQIGYDAFWTKRTETRNHMKNPLLKSMKIGFVGAGNMTQALIKGLIDSKEFKTDNILVSNRTPGKLLKLSEQYQVQTRSHNQEIINDCDVIVLAVKPQDLVGAMEGLTGLFRDNQTIISLAAGISFNQLQKLIPAGRLVRLMPNTPSLIGRGIIGYMSRTKNDDFISDLIQDLFGSLGSVIKVETEDQFDALMISCSSGTGFVFELMMYWQDWIEERGFAPEVARQMTIETFVGASLLAAQSNGTEIEELQSRVTSKKGVTAAGLQSLRELEVERAVRISFEKAAMRSDEISRSFK
jgi:pyrroline-5-carboxylate reductase